MSGTYPIKNKNTLEKFKNYYVNIHPNYRNYTMIVRSEERRVGKECG